MNFKLWGLVLLLVCGCRGESGAAGELRLTVMTFNTWGAGRNQGQPIDDTVAAIRAVQPDIVGLQEVRAEPAECGWVDCPASGPSVAPAIAKALGYELYEQSGDDALLWANAILSRYPLSGAGENGLGAIVRIGDRRIAFFNVHLDDYPYQPYQLTGIAHGDAPALGSEAAAITAARSARGSAVLKVLRDVSSVASVDAAFIVGDFNEPSHRDWTERAATIGRHPLRVRFPSAARVEEAGFVDAYRAHFPDEIEEPGFTWTPASPVDDPNDHHDRIDFIFVRADDLSVESAAVVGEKSPAADIVVAPWPSDHRAVTATVVIGESDGLSNR